jgi:hypothetical protein
MATMDDGVSTPARKLGWVLMGLVTIVVGLVAFFRGRRDESDDPRP